MSSRKPLAALAAIVLSLVMCFSLVACGTEPAATTKAPETQAPATQAPETKAPETKAPETQAPETKAPETEPDTKAPETEPVTPPDEDKYPSVGEPDPAESDDSKINNSKTFLLQESTFDGKFNPFFYTSAYDGDVCGLVNVGLLTVDPTGAVVAGREHDTVAQSYEIYYTNDLNTFAKKDTYEEGDYVVYEMVLKHGAKFSDGTDITAEDVLFNYYVLLDPAYVGSSTLYTLPILGLSAYRTQIADEAIRAALYEKAGKIFDATRIDYAANDDYTEDDYNLYWECIDNAGKAFAQDIVDYVYSNYGGNYNVGDPSKYHGAKDLDLTVDGNRIAFGMAMWGFGAFDSENTYEEGETGTKGLIGEKYATLYMKSESEEPTKFFDEDGTYYAQVKATDAPEALFTLASYEETDDGYKCVFDAYDGPRYIQNTVFKDTFTAGATGENFDMVDNFPTIDTYWENLQAGYADDDGVVDYANLEETESANVGLIDVAAENFVMANAEVGSVPNIAGLIAGETEVDGLKYETVKVVLTEQNPKAILSLGVTVTPKAYYTAGYTYPEGATVNAGVLLGLNDSSFM
ncbi:MAG: hypothetical protein IKR43_01545, partial [Lachnospiraceae bacterium]|nr:hypothetical protein [Lachnospiraceae bacterium]